MANVFWGAQGAVGAQANPAALMLGDSWFWYPLDNIALEIGNEFPTSDFVVIGKNGSEASEWTTKLRKDVDFAFKMYSAGVQALLLSGGGNDFAGMADFLRIIKDDCSKATTAVECYRPGQPDELISNVIAAYRAVTIKFRAYNADAPVLMHNYDYAWPTGKGVFGPAKWLKAPMDKARVPVGMRRDLLRDLLDKLGAAQKKLAGDKSLGKTVAIASAGTLPEDKNIWANELHPTPAGFKLLATNAFVPVLRRIIIG